ncbi:hypothetical protein D9M72_646130 [compost metagenome]
MAACRQAHIRDRAFFVKAPAEWGQDAAQDPQQVVIIAEALADGQQLPALGDMDIPVAVDEDRVDGRVAQQVIQGAEAGQFLDQRGRDELHFRGVDRDAPFLHEPLGLGGHIARYRDG